MQLTPLDTEGRAGRWRNVADAVYSPQYRAQFSYQQAVVVVQYRDDGPDFQARLSATGLKPHFTYQVKLEGLPGRAGNELLGQVGRWWQESWDGHDWSQGANLNDKGDGRGPSPNDRVQAAQAAVLDPASPTGRHFRHRAYLLFAWLTTDAHGAAQAELTVTRSYHALFKATQRTPEPDDGPVERYTIRAGEAAELYEAPPTEQTVSIFGEWERRPAGGVRLPAGDYQVLLLLGEESFHSSGGELAGNWARALGAPLTFTIQSHPPAVPPPPTKGP